MAYVANYESRSISVFAVDEAGALIPVGAVPAGAGVYEVAVHPSGRFAYSVNEDSTISGYRIVPETGMLEAMPTAPFAARGGSDRVVLHPSEMFAYAPDYDADELLVFTIDSDTGVLNLNEGARVALSAQPSSLAIDRAGRFLFVAMVDGRILSFGINGNTGELSLRSTLTGATAVVHMATAPAGNVLYVTRAARFDDHSISAHVISAGGNLSEPTFLEGLFTIHALSLDPAGRFVFTYEGNLDQRIGCYDVQDAATGALAFQRHTMIGWPNAIPNTITLDPEGRSVYLISSHSDGLPGSVVRFKVADDGTLTEQAPPAATGIDPFAITIVKLGG